MLKAVNNNFQHEKNKQTKTSKFSKQHWCCNIWKIPKQHCYILQTELNFDKMKNQKSSCANWTTILSNHIYMLKHVSRKAALLTTYINYKYGKL